MAIRNNYPPTPLNNKIDQYWELAGLARQDGDMADCERWTRKARNLQAGRAEDDDA